MTLWRIAQLILTAIYEFRGHVDARLRRIEDKLDAQTEILADHTKVLKSIQNAVEPSPAETLQLTIGKPVPNTQER